MTLTITDNPHPEQCSGVKSKKMRTSKNQAIASLLGMEMMLAGLNMDRPLISTRNYVPMQNGHTAWNTKKDSKCKKGRAKERRAKQARKLNWN